MIVSSSLGCIWRGSKCLRILMPMMHHPLSLSWQGVPTLQSPRNYFFEKKAFSPEFVECVNLRIPTHQEEKQGHFWPCQLQTLTPFIIVECKMQGVYFGVKTMWVLCILQIFTQNYHKTLTFFHVIFPDAAANTQQSTKKKGEIKAICGECFFGAVNY